MVLPPPAADPGVSPRLRNWLDELRLSLRLRRPSTLLLVTGAANAWLPTVLRTLRADGHTPQVCVRAAALLQVPAGRVALYLPSVDDLPALNEHRTSLTDRGLYVVFWCTTAMFRQLRLLAPDVYSLVANSYDGTPRLADHGLAGLRAAALAGAPGVVWQGPSVVDRVLSQSLPGAAWQRVSGRGPFPNMLATARGPRTHWLLWNGAHDPAARRRLRLALAEARRPFRNILEAFEDAHEPGWWHLHDRLVDPADATAQLAAATDPLTLATLCGLEPDALTLAATLLDHGMPEADLTTPLWTSPDPGATLATLAYDRGLLDTEAVLRNEAPPPVLRALARTLRAQGRRWAQQLRSRVDTDPRSVEPDTLRAWTARRAVQVDTAALAVPQTRATLMEPALRSDAPPWHALTLAALLTGAEDIAPHWQHRAETEATLPDASKRRVIQTLLQEWRSSSMGGGYATRTGIDAQAIVDALARRVGEAVVHVPRVPLGTDPEGAWGSQWTRAWIPAAAVKTAAPKPGLDIVGNTTRILQALGRPSPTLEDMVREIAAGLRAKGLDAEADASERQWLPPTVPPNDL